jgi:hypothetical protein
VVSASRSIATTGSSARHAEDRDARLVITFGADVELDLMGEALAIERDCCSFFTLDYDASARRPLIGIDDPGPADARTTLRSAVRNATRGAPMTSRSTSVRYPPQSPSRAEKYVTETVGLR